MPVMKASCFPRGSLASWLQQKRKGVLEKITDVSYAHGMANARISSANSRVRTNALAIFATR